MKQVVFLMCLLGLTFQAFAQAKAQKKVAIINIEQAILTTDMAKGEIKKLEADPEFKKNMDSIKKIQEEGQKLTEQYKKDGSLMSPKEIQALEAKIKAKQGDLEHIGKKVQEARATLMRGLMVQMNEEVTKQVKALIDAENIGLLLPANPQFIIHADPSFDITPKLTQNLNQKFKKKK